MNEKEYFYKKHQYLKEFILLYKNLPCLWRIKSKEYHIRELRTKAYKLLINKLREIDPTADRISVVKKINSLRSCVRKEHKKAANLAKQGVIYESRLWYYSLFDFLDGQERSKTGEKESEEESVEQNVKIEDGIEYSVEFDEDNDDPLESFDKPQEDDSSRDVASPSSPPPKRSKKTEPEFSHASSSKNTPERLSKVLNYEEPLSHGSREDQYDVFGKNVAAKLRDIAFKDNTQRLMAEKIINDALFMAEMGQLALTHCNKLRAE